MHSASKFLNFRNFCQLKFQLEILAEFRLAVDHRVGATEFDNFTFEIQILNPILFEVPKRVMVKGNGKGYMNHVHDGNHLNCFVAIRLLVEIGLRI